MKASTKSNVETKLESHFDVLLSKAHLIPQFDGALFPEIAFQQIYPVGGDLGAGWVLIVNTADFRDSLLFLANWIRRSGEWVEIAPALAHFRPRLERTLEEFVPVLEQLLSIELAAVSEIGCGQNEFAKREYLCDAAALREQTLSRQLRIRAEALSQQQKMKRPIKWVRI